MSDSTIRLETSLRASLLESLAVAFGCAIAITPLFHYLKGAGWGISLFFGLLAGLGAIAYYSHRFMRRGARVVELGPAGIRIEPRRGEPTVVEWVDIVRAEHRSEGGLCWFFTTEDREVALRDDGYDTEQWDEICGSVKGIMTAAGVSVEMTGLASVFDDDDEEEDEEDEDDDEDEPEVERPRSRANE